MAIKDPVVRRTISKQLQTRHGWSVKTGVDGKVCVAVPTARDPQQFAKEVRAAVEALDYHPNVYLRGREVVVTTPETLLQAEEGRGVHGAATSPIFKAPRTAPVAPQFVEQKAEAESPRDREVSNPS